MIDNLKPTGIYGLDRAVVILESTSHTVHLDRVHLGYVVVKIAEVGGWRRDGVTSLELIELAQKVERTQECPRE